MIPAFSLSLALTTTLVRSMDLKPSSAIFSVYVPGWTCGKVKAQVACVITAI